MNKIVMDNNKIILEVVGAQELDLSEYNCSELECNILSSASLFVTDINNNIEKCTFNCDSDSSLEINKFNSNDVLCKININLQERANARLIISTIANKENKYDINICHFGNYSYSKCINNGIVNDGTLAYNINGIIEHGALNCSVIQESKIITKNVKNATIKPVLVINETVEEANHSASIGYYNEEDLFYLESRGIDRQNAIKLINKGLLINNFRDKKKIENLI